VNAPELSVVIPTLGRVRTLPRVLDGLDRQDAPPSSFDIVVVVDARAPNPTAVERMLGQSHRARLLRAEKAGASAARNRGWRAAESHLILFLGDDVLPTRQLVAEHLAWHRRHPEHEVGVLGHVGWSPELRVTPFMRWLEHGMQFDYPNIDGVEAGWGRFYTANASVKRGLLDRAGGFDEERLPYLYEDLDLAYRMQATGFRLLYNRRAVGEHLHPADLESWGRRMALVAHAEREFVRKHPEIRPFFHDVLCEAAALPAARGRGAKLLRFVPHSIPWLGRRVWTSADLYYRQALAPDFLRAWDESNDTSISAGVAEGHPDTPEREPARSQSGGSPPGGPK
jgi:GT2 family glycosyltransferase